VARYGQRRGGRHGARANRGSNSAPSPKAWHSPLAWGVTAGGSSGERASVLDLR
jgi:hypothetical protein